MTPDNQELKRSSHALFCERNSASSARGPGQYEYMIYVGVSNSSKLVHPRCSMRTCSTLLCLSFYLRWPSHLRLSHCQSDISDTYNSAGSWWLQIRQEYKLLLYFWSKWSSDHRIMHIIIFVKYNYNLHVQPGPLKWARLVGFLSSNA